MPTLIDNWKRTLTHGYSAWCVYFAIAIQGVQEALPYLAEAIPTWLTLSLLGVGLLVRIVKQPVVSGADEPA